MMPEVFSKLSPIYAYPEVLKLLDNNTIIGMAIIVASRSVIKYKIIFRQLFLSKV